MKEDIKTLLVKREMINKELEQINNPDYIEQKVAEIYGNEFINRIINNTKTVLSEILRGY